MRRAARLPAIEGKRVAYPTPNPANSSPPLPLKPALAGHRGQRSGIPHREPGEFLLPLPLEPGVDVRARAHQPRADRGDVDPLLGQLAAQAVREADQGELAGAVGDEMGDGDAAADRGDVDDPPRSPL